MSEVSMEDEMRKVRENKKEEKRDRLSELPDCIVIHIMNLLNTKEAFRICILSKRWKELWKGLSNLSFSCWHSNNSNEYINKVLSDRDDCISLVNFELRGLPPTHSKLLNKAVRYAALHNVEQFTIDITCDIKNIDPLIFSCHSLTFLRLSRSFSCPPLELPPSLHLPSLEYLSLTNVTFTSNQNASSVDPFSTCHSLNTLFLVCCSLHDSSKLLSISNSNLSTLHLHKFEHKFLLSTPNLHSLKIIYCFELGMSYQLLSSSTCNLSCLEEGDIITTTDISNSAFISWLQLFTNVKKLTLTSSALKIFLQDLSNHAGVTTQPPCFTRLESLEVYKHRPGEISNQEIEMAAGYLLQNSSPLIRVTLIIS